MQSNNDDPLAVMADIINRRAAVETALWEAAAGKRPLPDAETCRELAKRLGIPSDGSPLRPGAFVDPGASSSSDPREVGAVNRERVRAILAARLGISRQEIADELGLSPMAVTRHVAAIRAEWGGAKLATRRAKNG